MTEINQSKEPRAAELTQERLPPSDAASLSSKRIVLNTFGSFGDIHPYIAVGLELRARGHRAVIATSPVYREKIEATGLGFHPVRPDIAPPEEDPETILKAMDVMKGGEFIIKELFAPFVRESYEDLSAATCDADLLVTHMLSFAGPALAEVSGIPWVSTVLAPTSFFSIYDPFVPPQAPGVNRLLRLSPLISRAFMYIARRVADTWIEPVYKFRSELGLSRGLHPVFEGQHSPALVLALFSKVMATPQPDWPPQTIITGFPFYDLKDETGLSPELKKFLDEGPRPIIFTLGSTAIFVAEDFYRESIKAAQLLKRRAVLLIGDARNMPKEILPTDIIAFDYAPYGQILPRAAAVVHQGGVGTTGQTLRAGVPALIIPFNHDQPDNAFRIARLGVGRTLSRSQYRAATAARELDKLLTDKGYMERAAVIGRQVQAEDGARTAADEIEKYLKNKTPTVTDALQARAMDSL
jgi:rhamnosyltransferase subunit B